MKQRENKAEFVIREAWTRSIFAAGAAANKWTSLLQACVFTCEMNGAGCTSLTLYDSAFQKGKRIQRANQALGNGSGSRTVPLEVTARSKSQSIQDP